MENSNLSIFDGQDVDVLAKMLAIASSEAHTEFEFKLFPGQEIGHDLFMACMKRLRGHPVLLAKDGGVATNVTLPGSQGVRVQVAGETALLQMSNDGTLPDGTLDAVTKVSYLQRLQDEHGHTKNSASLKTDTLQLNDVAVKATLRFELPSPLKQREIPMGSFIRIVRRATFSSDQSPVKYDLSMVRSGRITATKPADVAAQIIGIVRSPVTYEVEMEFVKPKSGKATIDQILVGLLPPLQALQGSDYLLRQTDMDAIKKDFDNMRASFVNPTTLTVETAPQLLDGYSVTEKSDGMRALLLVDKTRRVVSLQRSMRGMPIAYTGVRVKDPRYIGTLLDSEFMPATNTYKLFDCLFWCGKDVRKKPQLLPDADPTDYRLGFCGLWTSSVDLERQITYPTPSFETKKFILASGDEMWRACATLLDEATGPIDGLIFTPANEGYAQSDTKGSTWMKLLKYKPVHTIDFKVQFQGSDIRDGVKVTTVHLFIGKSGQDVLHPLKQLTGEYVPPKLDPSAGRYVSALFQPDVPFDPDAYIAYFPHDKKKDKPVTEEGQLIADGGVVECRYDAETRNWVPMRLRQEKTMGNNLDAALQIWAAINDPITEDMVRNGWDVEARAASGAYYNDLRISQRALDYRFHREIKASLYAEWAKPGSSLFEIGCGRGGDMNNWNKSKVATVLGLDVDARGLDNGSADSASLRVLKAKQAKRFVPKHVLFVHADAGKPFAESALSESSDAYMKILRGEKPAHTEQLQPFEGLMPKGFDTISAQFTVHYFFRDEGTLNVFIDNLKSASKPGTIIMGTCMDGGQIYGELLARESLRVANPAEPDKAAVEITREFDPKDKPWSDDALSVGIPIKVWVETFGEAHTEYLVPFGHFQSVMAAAGFDLVDSKSFKELFPDMHGEMPADQRQWSLLHRTFVFRRRSEAAPEAPAAKPKAVRIKRKKDPQALMANAYASQE